MKRILKNHIRIAKLSKRILYLINTKVIYRDWAYFQLTYREKNLNQLKRLILNNSYQTFNTEYKTSKHKSTTLHN